MKRITHKQLKEILEKSPVLKAYADDVKSNLEELFCGEGFIIKRKSKKK